MGKKILSMDGKVSTFLQNGRLAILSVKFYSVGEFFQKQ